MADEEGRSARDVEMARAAGNGFAGGVEIAGDMRRWSAAQARAGADALLAQLAEAARHHEELGAPFLGDERRVGLAKDLDAALRLLRFADAMELPGVAVLRGPHNAFQAPTLFDVFSRRARESIAPTPGPEVAAEDETRWPALRPWLMQAAERSREIDFVPQAAAARGFGTLLFDTLRATARVFKRSGGSATTLVFTLDSRNHGYAVDCYPQYRYAPVAFGSKLSRPVSAPLPTGHYHFQGWLNAVVTKEPRVFFAGPGSTSGTTQAF